MRKKSGKPTALEIKDLHRLIQETYANPIPPVDQIADNFRAKYSNYRRHKLQTFTVMVERALKLNSSKRKKNSSVNSRFIINHDDDEDENTSTSSRKRAKKYDNREQRLKMFETKESATESSSESESKSSSDVDRSAVSTAENDLYSMQSDPEFDLTKYDLRNGYIRLTKKGDVVDIDRGVKSVGKVKAQQPNNLSSDDGNEKKDGPMFKDFGGMDDVLKELVNKVLYPLRYPHLPRYLGFKPMTGILLHGPPGCGKSTLARAIGNETGFQIYEIPATKLVSGITGASEKNIRLEFEKAYKTAPSIIFIDEIDAIASKRDNHQRGMENRIVTELMTCMDQSLTVAKQPNTSKDPESSDSNPGYVLVIGTTNRPDALEPALRRPGRFDHEIALRVPDEKGRFQILKVLTRGFKLEGDVDLMKISRATSGYAGADLAGLVHQTGMTVVTRLKNERELELSNGSEENIDWRKIPPFSVEEMEKLGIGFKMSDFEVTVKCFQPSSKREGFSSIPNVKWEDVGGYDSLRREFDRFIVRRIKCPDEYHEVEKCGVNMPKGFLLYGPPGCGKTLIAKAVANEAGANFIYIKGPELLRKYVGESELSVRELFRRAKTCSPSIVFFDEVDALTIDRGTEGGGVVERLVAQLLIEIEDAVREGVYVIGATNRPEAIDKALKRPGRMEKQLYVSLPNPDERGLILKAIGRKTPLDADVDLMAIGRSKDCDKFSGADLKALMTEAIMAAFEESSLVGLPLIIKDIHIKQHLGKIRPSVSDKQKQYYGKLSKSKE